MKYYKTSDRRSGSDNMKYYSRWQEAFIDFINHYGHNYEDTYNLAAEFEEKLGRNIKGVWFIYFGDEND